MCGHDWCSVRISKEIVQFVSGKEESYAWDAPKISQALSAEQKEILEETRRALPGGAAPAGLEDSHQHGVRNRARRRAIATWPSNDEAKEIQGAPGK